MQKKTVSRIKTNQFSTTANKLVYEQEVLAPFIAMPFSIDNLKKQAKVKSKEFTQERRDRLVSALKNQLSAADGDCVKQNIEKLSFSSTVTITTGHQLNLYSGPLYVIYKIMHVIALSEILNENDAEVDYVPVFWMATEDHDFEEINHFHLFNDTLTWETHQSGPVGRFVMDDFNSTREALLGKFENNPNFANYLAAFYEKGALAASTREFIHSLFSDYGLIILDADDQSLKRSFAPIMKEELINHVAEPLVQQQTSLLEAEGIGGQVTPRPVNLFFIQNGRRDRIIPENGGFLVGDERFTQEEFLYRLEKEPDCFSPNVVTRPVYQEFILPNICYVGGGGEMSYWLQLKSVFEAFGVSYPLIQVRNSVQFIEGIALKKLKKLELEITDLFKDVDQLKKDYVLKNEQGELDFQELEAKGQQLSEEILGSVASVDDALLGYARSEVAKLEKQIGGIKQKLIRHSKKKHDDAMSQFDNLFERLFPAGGLQERYDNVIPKLAKYGKDEFIKLLHEKMDPLEKDLILLIEED